MTHTLVKQLVNEDGDQIPKKDQCWHALQDYVGDAALICTGEFIEEGAMGGGAVYKLKVVKRGGITCQKCLNRIKFYKAIKL